MGPTLTLVLGNTGQETEMLWSASIDRRREALSGAAFLTLLGRWRG